jgi:GNAT superfamily N-acetyltransferase
MTIRDLRPEEHAAALALVDAELRPPGAQTRAVEDFPLALGRGNREGWLVAEGEQGLTACLNCLIRPFVTSLGELPIAAIGSVVTRPEARGRGLSRDLQAALLTRLREEGVPLAVLWSDRPEIYEGRGFRPAGLEYHVELAGLQPPGWEFPAPGVRPFEPRDVAPVARLYRRHPFHTVRRQGDDARLYGMPGTRGYVLEERGGEILAYAFCGKGADFAGYVVEWGGQSEALTGLLAWLAHRGLARHLLVPQGEEPFLGHLGGKGAAWCCLPSGLWCVLAQEVLRGAARERNLACPAAPARGGGDAAAWLGSVQPDGLARPGPLQLAVWGFDSV